MFIEVEDCSEIECLFAVLSLGLYTAIEHGCLSTEDAERYLFLPSTLGILQKAGASDYLLKLVQNDLGIDLSEHADLEDYDSSVASIQEALEDLNAGNSIPFEDWCLREDARKAERQQRQTAGKAA